MGSNDNYCKSDQCGGDGSCRRVGAFGTAFLIKCLFGPRSDMNDSIGRPNKGADMCKTNLCPGDESCAVLGRLSRYGSTSPIKDVIIQLCLIPSDTSADTKAKVPNHINCTADSECPEGFSCAIFPGGGNTRRCQKKGSDKSSVLIL